MDELSKHIENNKEILLKKKEELENQTKTVNQCITINSLYNTSKRTITITRIGISSKTL